MVSENRRTSHVDGPVYKRPFSTLRKNDYYYAAQQLEGAFLALAASSSSSLASVLQHVKND